MTKALSKHLLIQSPSEITQAKVWSQLERDYMSAAPPFRFRRSREVDASALSWMGELWNGDAADNWQQKNAVQAVRYLLETIWVSNPEAARDTVAVKARNNIKPYPDQPLAADHPDWLPQLVQPLPDQADVPVLPGAVIAVAKPDGNSSKGTVLYYMLESHDEAPLGAESFPNDGDPDA